MFEKQLVTKGSYTTVSGAIFGLIGDIKERNNTTTVYHGCAVVGPSPHLRLNAA